MFRSDDLTSIAELLRTEPARVSLLDVLRSRSAPVLQGVVAAPSLKALLSRTGGICPNDGATLRFDPLQPQGHACPRCGAVWSGERHDRHWVRSQHLWLAERVCDLAVLAILAGEAPAAEAAQRLLLEYAELYPRLPNRDNVLGPSHLFFSTYLESIWITHLLAGAYLLREHDALSVEVIGRVGDLVEEAAELIGGFNEGLSNRQTWHAAALTAIAAWFEDEELAQSAIEARTGLLGHLTDGFGEDGLWHEGENYHLFAMRGLMLGLQWARVVGADLLDDPELRGHFRSALLAPARTALPDLSYPARGDARYGVSLGGQPYLELWRIGHAWLGGDPELEGLLAALESVLPGESEGYDAWLHDAGRPVPSVAGDRPLSWWWALTAPGEPGAAAPVWHPEAALLARQRLAILRQGDHYLSMECGPQTGGHGHPDRLHLTLYAGGVHWLPDPGTGSYVNPTLAWYRSALCHNAPMLDGENAGGYGAQCTGFAMSGEWGWARGRAGPLTRSVVLGPRWALDVLELDAQEATTLSLPWHFLGDLDIEPAPAPVEDPDLPPYVSAISRATRSADTAIRIRVHRAGAALGAALSAPGAELLLLRGPGLPAETQEREFVLVRATGTAARWISAIGFGPESPALEVAGEAIVVRDSQGTTTVEFTPAGVTIRPEGSELQLGGILAELPERPLPRPEYGWDARGRAVRVWQAPALDGSLENWDLSEPLDLAGEHHYRASEEPYDPEFTATAWLNRDPEGLYIAVEVVKADLVLRPAAAPPLDLDNEPDDIHADGLQLYLAHEDLLPVAMVVSLDEDGGIRARPVAGTTLDQLRVKGSWQRTGDGYRVTVGLLSGKIAAIPDAESVGFDLIVNEMRPGRERRAGQLVWSGGHGWVYLRGDRQDPIRFGRIELG